MVTIASLTVSVLVPVVPARTITAPLVPPATVFTPVVLTATEFDLLAHLMARPGRILTREQLLSEVWGYAAVVGTRTVDVHVRRLREKLPILTTALTTVKQFGYKLEDTP